MVRSTLETALKNRPLSATVKDLHQEFSESVKDLKETQEWEKMLEGASKFHHYSLRNMMLILRQNPEATQCAGYTTWKKLGYQVRKGEKGLKILAPRTLIEKDSQGNPRRNDAGDIIRKKVFGMATVFDASQVSATDDAQPFPGALQNLGLDHSQRDSGIGERLEQFITSRGWQVTRKPLGAVLGGYTSHQSKHICINSDLLPTAQTKTLVHEITHALLHHDLAPQDYAHNHHNCRSIAETEAESVAYIVAQACGLDAAHDSISYVANWSQQDPKIIQSAAQNVQKTAHEILAYLEKSLS